MDDLVTLVSAGAARALVHALTAGGYDAPPVTATFGPVGVVHDAATGDGPVDIVISSRAGLAALDDVCDPADVRDIGAVPTVLAVPAGDPMPGVATPADLAAVLGSAGALYCGDLEKSTAGRYVAHLLIELGLSESLRPRLRTRPDGASALRAMVADRGAAVAAGRAGVGTTDAAGAGAAAVGGPSTTDRRYAIAQLTEVRETAGAVAVADAPLPAPHGLATVYAVAVTRRSDRREAANRLVAALTGRAAAALRARCGFGE